MADEKLTPLAAQVAALDDELTALDTERAEVRALASGLERWLRDGEDETALRLSTLLLDKVECLADTLRRAEGLVLEASAGVAAHG